MSYSIVPIRIVFGFCCVNFSISRTKKICRHEIGFTNPKLFFHGAFTWDVLYVNIFFKYLIEVENSDLEKNTLDFNTQ